MKCVPQKSNIGIKDWDAAAIEMQFSAQFTHDEQHRRATPLALQDGRLPETPAIHDAPPERAPPEPVPLPTEVPLRPDSVLTSHSDQFQFRDLSSHSI